MKAEKLFPLCRKIGIEATDSFWNSDPEKIFKNYNGAGPDWLPKWGRTVLTLLLWLFKIAFMVHDWDYLMSDKTLEGFNAANARMWRNMKKILNYYLGAWYLRSLYDFWYIKAFAAYEACKLGGWSAWIDESPEEEK
ncbi:MAG: hypothetical protein PHV82_11510 [Victivallaceae bacterium]|nr:hypothetical protein [Victivallaceae bacterium]